MKTVMQARFLATHNSSLTERVIRLERDLALVQGVRSNLTSRLQAYEKFVADMLNSLARKRTVKITDGSGKEVKLDFRNELYIHKYIHKSAS